MRIKIKKRLARLKTKGKKILVYFELIFCLMSGGLSNVGPVNYSVGTPLTLNSFKKFDFNEILLEKRLQTELIRFEDHPFFSENHFSQNEIAKISEFALKYKKNLMNEKQLLSSISQLRGGSFTTEILEKLRKLCLFAIVTYSGIVMFSTNTIPYIPEVRRGRNIQQEWVDIDYQRPNVFGYQNKNQIYCDSDRNKFSRNFHTQNAASADFPSSGYWEYSDLMEHFKKLVKETGKTGRGRMIELGVGGEIYLIKCGSNDTIFDLEEKLAKKLYNSIRESNTDVFEIAQHLG